MYPLLTMYPQAAGWIPGLQRIMKSYSHPEPSLNVYTRPARPPLPSKSEVGKSDWASHPSKPPSNHALWAALLRTVQKIIEPHSQLPRRRVSPSPLLPLRSWGCHRLGCRRQRPTLTSACQNSTCSTTFRGVLAVIISMGLILWSYDFF